MKKAILLCVVMVFSVMSMPSQAEDAKYMADSAVADILFDYDDSATFATYSVDEEGFVEITFASNMPDDLYSELLARLKGHKDITGVLAGTSGPACPLFP